VETEQRVGLLRRLSSAGKTGRESLTPADLSARFDAARFSENEIYPEIWDEPRKECLDDYVLHYFSRLKDFVHGAHTQGKALIVYIN